MMNTIQQDLGPNNYFRAGEKSPYQFKYSINGKRKYLCFKTLVEAQQIRDECLKNNKPQT